MSWLKPSGTLRRDWARLSAGNSRCSLMASTNWLGSIPNGFVQFGLLEQRDVAGRAVQLRGNREQAGGRVAGLQGGQCAPGLKHFGQARNSALAHLVAARATKQQGDQVALLGAQALGARGLAVTDHGLYAGHVSGQSGTAGATQARGLRAPGNTVGWRESVGRTGCGWRAAGRRPAAGGVRGPAGPARRATISL